MTTKATGKMTPGPWEADLDEEPIQITAGGPNPKWPRQLIANIVSTGNAFKDEANARAIAAVPDMLDVLRELVNHDEVGLVTAMKKARALLQRIERE